MSAEYRFSLDAGRTKFHCPACSKRRFVKFINNHTGEYLSDDYGRCDRQESCGYFKAPDTGKKIYYISCLKVDEYSEKALQITDSFGTINYVPKSAITENDNNGCWVYEWFLIDSNINYSSTEFKFIDNDVVYNYVAPKVIEPEPTYHELELLDDLFINEKSNDNLTKWLLSMFPAREVNTAKLEYFITSTNQRWNNTTIFWQIDENELIHGGKMMLYNDAKGKRVKEPKPCIDWLHRHVKNDEFNLKQCLFGLHLINTDYSKPIAICEAEKGAYFMRVLFDHFIWLATGSEGNLKYELLKPIKNREIILYPDKGKAFTSWSKKANELNNKGFKITVSKILEESDLQDGSDLVDYYLLKE